MMTNYYKHKYCSGNFYLKNITEIPDNKRRVYLDYSIVIPFPTNYISIEDRYHLLNLSSSYIINYLEVKIPVSKLLQWRQRLFLAKTEFLVKADLPLGLGFSF